MFPIIAISRSRIAAVAVAALFAFGASHAVEHKAQAKAVNTCLSDLRTYDGLTPYGTASTPLPCKTAGTPARVNAGQEPPLFDGEDADLVLSAHAAARGISCREADR